MIDEQIKNIPECDICGLKWSKYAPLLLDNTGLKYCGNCILKVFNKQKEQRKKWLQELKDE